MESNGVPGRIHVSQETADELIARGKGTWLTLHQDKITAKGKGELQTYFCNISSSKSILTSNVSTQNGGDDDDDEDRPTSDDDLHDIEDRLNKRNNKIAASGTV